MSDFERGFRAGIETAAAAVEVMTDEHRRAGHRTLSYQLNDTRRDQYRAIAAYVRSLAPTAKPAEPCPANPDGRHAPWHDDGPFTHCKCGAVLP